jgi:hypothetical protein
VFGINVRSIFRVLIALVSRNNPFIVTIAVYLSIDRRRILPLTLLHAKNRTYAGDHDAKTPEYIDGWRDIDRP